MAYKDFIQALDKLLGYKYPSSYFILSAKLFHNVSIVFGFDGIEISRGFSSTQICYEELPNLQIVHTVKNGFFSTKNFLSLKSSKGIILEKIPLDCERSLNAIINLSKENFYSSRKQDIELFNTSNARTFKIPLTTAGYSCIPYYNVFEYFYSTEIGNKILLDLLNTWYEDSDSYIEFLLEMIKLISEEGKIHFIGTGTKATFRIKKNWYIFTGSGYDTYSKKELDMYSEDDTKFYLANQNDPPEILSEFFESEVLICDDKITDNLLEYDDEIFNPPYEEDEYEDEYDDSEEDNDWDNDEESDSYEYSEDDNYSDDDDESDDYDTEEDDELSFDDRITNRAKKLGLSDDSIEPITDGIINEDCYYDAPFQILWVLKEPYDDGGGDWSICTNLIKNYRECYDDIPTYRSIINTSYCLLNDISTIEDDLSDYQIEETVNAIAIINTSKMPGGTSSNNSEIRRAYKIWKDIILDQIDSYEPDIIIFGVSQLVFDAYYEDIDDIEGESGWFELHRNNQLILNSHHPSAPAYSGQRIINAVREWQGYDDEDEDDDDDE